MTKEPSTDCVHEWAAIGEPQDRSRVCLKCGVGDSLTSKTMSPDLRATHLRWLTIMLEYYSGEETALRTRLDNREIWGDGHENEWRRYQAEAAALRAAIEALSVSIPDETTAVIPAGFSTVIQCDGCGVHYVQGARHWSQCPTHPGEYVQVTPEEPADRIMPAGWASMTPDQLAGAVIPEKPTGQSVAQARANLGLASGPVLWASSSGKAKAPLRDSDAAFNLGVLPTEQPEKASELRPCPIPAVDGMDIDGRQLAPDVFGVGKLSWKPESGDWRCLANVSGALCVIQVSVRPENGNERTK